MIQRRAADTNHADEDGTLLSAQDLVKHFPIGRGKGRTVVRAVNGVSFTIQRGETLGLVGESGSGKTTVGRLILGLLRPTSGGIAFQGEQVVTPERAYGNVATRRRIQAVFQDPYGSLNPRMRVRDTLREAARQLGVAGSKAEADDLARELLRMVGLSAGVAARFPHELSAGEQQKVGIARAFASHPDVIVLDEPTSALSPQAREDLVELLRDVQARTGTSYLFISHDLSVVREIATRVAVMYLGKIVALGSGSDIFAHPVHPYTEALLSSILRPDPTQRGTVKVLSGEIPSPIHIPPGCAFASRCDWAIDACRSVEPPLEPVLLGPGQVMHVSCGRAEERLAHIAQRRDVDVSEAHS